MKYLNTTDCSLFLAERSKFMTKYALIGVLAVCATVLCFSLILGSDAQWNENSR